MTLEIMSYLAPFKTRLAKSMKARENLWWNKGTTAHRTLGVGTCECSTPEGRRRKTYNQKISCSSADRVWNKILFGNSVVRNIIWIDYRSTINSVTIEKLKKNHFDNHIHMICHSKEVNNFGQDFQSALIQCKLGKKI